MSLADRFRAAREEVRNEVQEEASADLALRASRVPFLDYVENLIRPICEEFARASGWTFQRTFLDVPRAALCAVYEIMHPGESHLRGTPRRFRPNMIVVRAGYPWSRWADHQSWVSERPSIEVFATTHEQAEPGCFQFRVDTRDHGHRGTPSGERRVVGERVVYVRSGCVNPQTRADRREYERSLRGRSEDDVIRDEMVEALSRLGKLIWEAESRSNS
jgi:hypothetical protein